MLTDRIKYGYRKPLKYRNVKRFVASLPQDLYFREKVTIFFLCLSYINN